MKKAFTLIELLAVIVIIAIIATIGVFTITKIINKSRENSLNSVASNIKRAAFMHFSDEMTEATDPIEIDMTPGSGSFSKLVDLSKDPWGDLYVNVRAIGNKNLNGQIEVTVYMVLERGDYALYHNASELVELKFIATNLSAPATLETNNNITITYIKDNAYTVTSVMPVLKKNGISASAADYSIVGSTESQITLLMKNPGNYEVSLILQRELGDDSEPSLPINFVVNEPPPPPLNLAGTYYFNNTTRLVNGVNYHTLTTTYNIAGNYFGYNEPSCVQTGTLRAFSRIARISSTGVETTISSWRQAPVAIGGAYYPVIQTNTYTFPGWSNASSTDSLMVEIGLSDVTTGLPVHSRKFVTNQLGNGNVLGKTFTIYYFLDNDWDEGCYANFTYGGNRTEDKRAKIIIN